MFTIIFTVSSPFSLVIDKTSPCEFAEKAPFFKQRLEFMISEMSIILICSIVIGMFVTEWFVHYVYMPFYFWQSLGVYALTSVIILILSAVITLVLMRKYDVCTLIK